MKLRRMKRHTDPRLKKDFSYKKRNQEMLEYYRKVKSYKLTGDKFLLTTSTVRQTLIKMEEFKG